MPRDLEERKEIEKPAGRASDQPPRVSGAGGKGKDFFEGERSDRESGRPLQLEDDEDGEERNDQQSGRPVQLEERPSERPKDRQHRSAREVDSTKR